MQTSNQKIVEINQIAADRFDKVLTDEFVAQFNILLDGEKIEGSLIQISTDIGEELEVGFFTASKITDITLSKGKIYFYSYPIKLINDVTLFEHDSKWVLSIIGEKKFDYNVVKPGSIDALKKYKDEIQNYLDACRCSNHSFLIQTV